MQELTADHDTPHQTLDQETTKGNIKDESVWHTKIDIVNVQKTVTKENENQTADPPDGGWGWIVLITTCISFVINFGLLDSYGLVYTVMADRYNVPLGTLTWIGSCNVGTGCVIGGLAPMIIKRLGSRLAGVLATALTTGGLFLSVVLDNVYAMYMTFGGMLGFGFYLQFLNCMMMLNVYFDRRRVLAVGILYSCAGLGSVVFAPMLTALLSSYGFWGMLLITGAVSLNQLWCVLTFRPLSRSSRNKLPDKTAPEEIKGHRVENAYISLLKRKTVWCFVLSASANGFVNAYFTSFIPSAAKIQFGFSLQQISIVISVYGIVNTCTRFVVGCVFTAVRRSVIPTYAISSVACGLVAAVFPFCDSYPTMMVASGMYGLFYGMYASLHSTVVYELAGRQLFSHAYGLSFIATGSCNLVGIPFGGFAYDMTQSFNIVFYIAAGGLVLAGLAVFPVTFACFRRLDDPVDGLTVSIQPRRQTQTNIKDHRSKA